MAQLVSVPVIQAESLKVNDQSEKSSYSQEYFDNNLPGGPEKTQSTPVPEVKGHMTGGGSVVNDNIRVTHSFELKCDAGRTLNNLEVKWDKGNEKEKQIRTEESHPESNKFHLENLTTASCRDDPYIKPNPPDAGFDTYEGNGTGRYNGVPGATADWIFTDAGEPGNKDSLQSISGMPEADLSFQSPGNWQEETTRLTKGRPLNWYQ